MSQTGSSNPLSAKEAALRLIGFYPTITASDPEIYASGLVHMFSQYPAHLVTEAVDPARGLPSLHDFPPSMKQVKDFLEPRMQAERATNDRLARQLRPRLPPVVADPESERRIASGLNDLVEHLKSGFGPSTAT